MSGAPTKYDLNPETGSYEDGYTVTKAREYLETFEEEGDAIPSTAGLAVYLKVARSSVNLWATDKNKKEFSDTLEEIQANQEKILLNRGLLNEFNSTITKLALANHGYSDKQEVEVSEKSVTPWDELAANVDE